MHSQVFLGHTIYTVLPEPSVTSPESIGFLGVEVIIPTVTVIPFLCLFPPHSSLSSGSLPLSSFHFSSCTFVVSSLSFSLSFPPFYPLTFSVLLHLSSVPSLSSFLFILFSSCRFFFLSSFNILTSNYFFSLDLSCSYFPRFFPHSKILFLPSPLIFSFLVLYASFPIRFPCLYSSFLSYGDLVR